MEYVLAFAIGILLPFWAEAMTYHISKGWHKAKPKATNGTDK